MIYYTVKKGVEKMIADTIKELREYSGFTQTELAKKLDVTRSSVNAWELGISCPSTQYLIELSRIFSVSTDYLLGLKQEQTVCLDELNADELSIIHSLLEYFKNSKS